MEASFYWQQATMPGVSLRITSEGNIYCQKLLKMMMQLFLSNFMEAQVKNTYFKKTHFLLTTSVPPLINTYSRRNRTRNVVTGL
jgi:hypothetical protein